MASATFVCTQFEFGRLLGPADGRYVIRPGGGEASHVAVLRTLGAPQRRRLKRGRAVRTESAEPAPVPTARATLVRAEPLESPTAAAAWLEALRKDTAALEGEAMSAAIELNVVLHAHRVATADPWASEVRPEQALVIRIGYATGDQAADGRFSEAYELPTGTIRTRRTDRLAPQERLAAILGGQERPLVSEDLVLRARADLDGGRMREAALQCRIALEGLLADAEAHEDLTLGALPRKRDLVGRAANEALSGDLTPALEEEVEATVAEMETALRRRRLRSF